MENRKRQNSDLDCQGYVPSWARLSAHGALYEHSFSRKGRAVYRYFLAVITLWKNST